MNIFDLRNKLISDYADYINSFIQIRDTRIDHYVEQELMDKAALWPEPLIQLNPQFEHGASIDELVADDLLHPACSRIFRLAKSDEDPAGIPLRLHRHQEEAVRIARGGHSYVLTTGTGSGKSLAYIIPIVDYILRHPGQHGIKAIVVYPMNALANSQKNELEKYPGLNTTGHPSPVTFARYTGQELEPERESIIADPPDILLTNYVMLELILTRQRERQLIASKTLRFLVLDELHTYRGRQGADVALLVRRVRDRLAGETLQYVGTSATLAGDGSFDQQRHGVAEMASRVFGVSVKPEHVISETLVRTTPTVDEASPEFRRQLTERVISPERQPPQDYESFLRDPLSIWLESTFGLTSREGRWVRTMPRRIYGPDDSYCAAALLRQLTNASIKRCVEVIQEGLLAGYEQVKHLETGQPPFAFRLHQFISKGDTVYASLEDPEQRHLTLQRQQFVPGDRSRVLLPMVFCRECGQEYYCVSFKDGQYIWRELSDQSQDEGLAGFLFFSQDHPWPTNPEEIDQRLPEEWVQERNGKLQVLSNRKRFRPQPVRVRSDGAQVDSLEPGIDGHFLLTPFRFCLRCGVSYDFYQKDDFAKLTSLSSEGRSTSTTILSLSAIRHLREAHKDGAGYAIEPKMLSFTDNRQDASLQAGHFNDFVEVGLLRSALYRAVKEAGSEGLRYDDLTHKVFEALRLPLEQYAVDTQVKYQARTETDRAFRNVLGYRLYRDLKRGWRITSPNLEQCGLLVIDYLSLAEVCEDEEVWEDCHEALQHATPDIRREIAKTLLDYMRRELAIKVDYLNATYQEILQQQSSQRLIAPWALDENEAWVYATVLFPRSRTREDYRDNIYLSGLSSFGQYLKRTFRNKDLGNLKTEDVQLIIEQLLEGLRRAGLVEMVVEPRHKHDTPGYQLPASAIIWSAGDGTRAFHDPIRVPRAPKHGRYVNPFFRQYYQIGVQSLQRIQAREHTAQVPNEIRMEREEAFREGELPILYCSPTMELGVDIAELNIVNMRNIPPTPANYAQRSGRAGRSGQPALVFSYCSTGSPHDQYFFRHPEQMVKGAVTPPRLELTNEDLIRAHIHAIWLAETRLSLEKSLKDLLDVSGATPSMELLPEVCKHIDDEAARGRAKLQARRVLDTLMDELRESNWYTDNWLDDVLHHVHDNFDRTCERWRSLYRAAQSQFDAQNTIIRDASRSPDDKKQAERLRAEAQSQLSLLTNVDKLEQSDFYSYRYFASEGFLPGYNFPRLPLSAYIPARRTKQHDEYLSRPRFLAISEFAPRAIIYHEGSRYVINRSIFSVNSDDGGILTSEAKQCSNCGYLHPLSGGDSIDVCKYCQKPLPAPLQSLFKLQNVSTRRRDKINSDEEERLRQGYDIRTAVRLPERNGHLTSFVGAAEYEGDLFARLTYGQAATLWRINFGPMRRKRKDTLGFVLDTERGYWSKEDDAADDPGDPMSPRTQRVIPYVEDWRNCLLFDPLVAYDAKAMASLQAVLKSAIQIKYQLEDNELAAEPLPGQHDRRLLLFYEAAEGGAGALRQLIDNPEALAEVAGEALRLCHFDPDTGDDLRRAPQAQEDCEAACYNCLMTYTNQHDHRLLDRQAIRDILLRLAQTLVRPLATEPLSDRLSQLLQLATCEVEAQWLRLLDEQGYQLPAVAHASLAFCGATPDFLYEEDGLAVYVDGAPEVYPERAQRDVTYRDDLEDNGYMVLRFGEPGEWAHLFAQYPHIFGRSV